MSKLAPHPSTRTPVLFLIFRRPELSLQVLAAIRAARPAVLLIAADGPRPGHAEEARLCAETRAAVLAGIDWPCQVQTRFREHNLGCKRAVAEALDWAFAQHERLIIVEDDCLPDPSFFPWCEAALERYQNDERVMQVCGSNLTGAQPEGGASGFASRFGPIWGWATWRRAWRHYDVELGSWPEWRRSDRLKHLFPEPFEASWRCQIFDAVHAGEIDTWDYQWAYAKAIRNGVSLIPERNLVQNLGFRADATHTRDPRMATRLSRPTQPLTGPWRWPEEVRPWRAADSLYLRQIVGLPSHRFEAWLQQAKRAIGMLLRTFGLWPQTRA